MTMGQQAQKIDSVFSAFKLGVRVAPPPASFLASSYTIFAIQRQADIPVAKIENKAPELEEALGLPVRFSRMPLALEVARPDARRLPLLSLWPRLREMKSDGLFSITGQGAERRQLTIKRFNLADAATPHALIAGTTGSGKTELLRSILLSAAAMQSPAMLAMVVIDPKAVDFRSLYGLPHLACNVVSDPEEGVLALRAVVDELERRKSAGMKEPQQRIVVAIDELADLMAVAGTAVESHIQRIISVGRGLGVHIIAATQHPLADIVGSVVKANFPLRIVGKTNDASASRVAAGIPDTGAERLHGKGSFLAINGHINRVQAYHCTPEEERRLIDAISIKWQHAHPHYTVRLDDAPKVSVSVESIPVPGTPDNVTPQLVAVIRKYIVKTGKAPSQRKVQAFCRKHYGKMLPWPDIKKALAQASNATQ
jgi:FtsK/SpoIIIE family